MADTRGLIDPATFHPTAAQLKRGAHAADGLVRQTGQGLADLGERVADQAVAISNRWAGLSGCYQAPESERVLGLVAPAATAAEEVRGALVAVKVALGIYADALWAVAEKLAALEAEAAAFRASDAVVHGVKDTSNDTWTAVNGLWAAGHGDLGGGKAALDRLAAGTVPWWQDQATVAKNEGYWQRLYQYQQDIEEAAWVCSTMICQAAAPQATSQALSAGVDTTEQIEAFDAAQGWGRPRERGLLPGEQAWNGLNRNLLAPAAALAFGWDTTTRAGFARTGGTGAEAERAREETRSQAWGGLATVATAFIVGYAAQGPWAQDVLDARYGQGWTDQNRQIVADTALSLIAYDPSVPEDAWHTWRDAPYEAGTTVAVNVAGLVAGPKALGALGKTTTGGRAGLTAARTADAPSAAIRAAETATDARATASTALEKTARTDPPSGSPHPPRVSDSIRKPGDNAPGQSWLYQDTPEPTPAQRAPSTPAREPELVNAERTRQAGTTTSRPTDPHGPTPGRAADTVTTQPIRGLPRPPEPAARLGADELPVGTGRDTGPAAGPGHSDLSGPNPDGPTGDGHGPVGRGDLPDQPAHDPGPVDRSALPPQAHEAIGRYERMISDELAQPDPEYWRINRWQGQIFNWENYHRYPANEVYLDLYDPNTGARLLNADGSPRRVILDSYTPGQEVVSRKRTQLGSITESTAREYINQALRLYAPDKPGITIADVPTTQAQLGHMADTIGRPLKGRLILEVPVQNQPVPESILRHALENDVTIRDVNNRTYRLEEEVP